MNDGAGAESAVSMSSAPPAENLDLGLGGDSQPRPEVDLDTDLDLSSISSSIESADYAESSATEDGRDWEEDSDFVAQSTSSQDASSFASELLEEEGRNQVYHFDDLQVVAN